METPTLTLIQDAKILLEKIAKLNGEIIGFHYRLGQLELNQFSKEDRTDLGFLHREAEDLFDEMRKNCKAQKEKIGKNIAEELVSDFENGVVKDSVKGKLARGQLHIETEAILPKKGDPTYNDMARFYGLSEEAIEAGIFQVHYNHVKDYFTKLDELGKPYPKGVVTTKKNATMKFVKHK